MIGISLFVSCQRGAARCVAEYATEDGWQAAAELYRRAGYVVGRDRLGVLRAIEAREIAARRKNLAAQQFNAAC